MKKIYQLIVITFAAIFCLIAGTTYGHVAASELNFSVIPVIPENQQDKQKTYYDLQVTPLTEQTLTIQLKNATDKEVTVIPTIKTATTNLNGVVEYGVSNSEPDDTIQYRIEDLVKSIEEEVTIPAKGTADLHLTVSIPKEAFDGILAGGITLEQKETTENKQEKQDKEEASLSIENQYAYVVAIVLNENDQPVASELKLKNVIAEQINNRNVISATLQNTKPKFQNKLLVKASVTEKGKKEIVYESETSDMQMAPNSSFAYPIKLNGEALKAGKYTLDLVAESKGETWHFTEDFEITKDEADTLNKQDVTIKKEDSNLYLIVGGILALLAVAIVLYILRKKFKEKNREVEKLRHEINGESRSRRKK
ncbi:DUF916 and DUF3324 domain-containing protein [Isobaculum melis]|uniref:Uncharacterized protein n=1 Tax=Isobaculum melis TaxID=142588 RepID=A0A1H9SQV3_9LACT|nr:DUF916 and DUF3324 domain-containing protein [Isobaculum melis]SER87257.1 protein of unknown function [Isobaculum melis]